MKCCGDMTRQPAVVVDTSVTGCETQVDHREASRGCCLHLWSQVPVRASIDYMYINPHILGDIGQVGPQKTSNGLVSWRTNLFSITQNMFNSIFLHIIWLRHIMK